MCKGGQPPQPHDLIIGITPTPKIDPIHIYAKEPWVANKMRHTIIKISL